MSRIDELKNKMKENLRKMRDIIDRAEDEKRDMSESEDAEYKRLDSTIDKLKYEIGKVERMSEIETESRRIMNPLNAEALGGNRRALDDGGFSGLGEMLYAISEYRREGKIDDRLEHLRETREQSLGGGSGGGFNVADAFLPQLLQVQPQDAIVLPRCTVIPAGSPPDAKLLIPCLDQTSSQSIYGGVAVGHSGEALTLSETDAAFRQIVLEPKKLGAYLVCSNELLANWEASDAVLSMLLQKSIMGQFDQDCLTGNGVNKAVGIINSPAAISYSRAGANTITWPDVYGMYARLKMGGSPVWLASQTTIPSLVSMVDAGTHSVFISGSYTTTGAAMPFPATLMGFPLLFVDKLPKLGTKGDLCLVDLKYYLVKLGSGPQIDISKELLFLSDRSVFRVTMRADGKSWLSEPIVLEGDSSSSVSPFVILE